MRRNSKHAEMVHDSSKLLGILYDSKKSAVFHETVSGARKSEIEAYYEKLNVITPDEFAKHDGAVEKLKVKLGYAEGAVEQAISPDADAEVQE